MSEHKDPTEPIVVTTDEAQPKEPRHYVMKCDPGEFISFGEPLTLPDDPAEHERFIHAAIDRALRDRDQQRDNKGE